MKSQQQKGFDLNVIKEKSPSMSQDELKSIGDGLIANYEYQNAINIYTLALEKDASFCNDAAAILSERSLCFFTLGKYKEAYDDAEKCCALRPDWPRGFARRAASAQRLEEWQIALESYDKYLKLDPKDEAGVKSDRKSVAKVVARTATSLERKEREIEDLEQRLAQIKDQDRRLAWSYVELMKAAENFDIERMKIALKQPIVPRLDTPFSYDVDYETLPLGFWPQKKHRDGGMAVHMVLHPNGRQAPDCDKDEAFSLCFLPPTLEAARKKFQSGSPGILLVGEALVKMLSDESKARRVSMTRQAEYLYFVLDIVETQGFNNPTKPMMSALRNISWYDPTSSKHDLVPKPNLKVVLD